MRWHRGGWLRLFLLLALLVGSAPLAAPASARPAIAPGTCQRGTLPHGALSLMCVPTDWNGELVVFAHGYVAFNQPLDFYHLTLDDGTYLPDLVQWLGFAFATTSYRQNGLAVLEGVADIRELVAAFRQSAPRPPTRTYLTGVSEGGLVSALLAERHPELFNAVLAACGPIGNFRLQVNYIGDFRVLFDYFFPGVLPGSPIQIPSEVIANFDAVYAPRIAAAVLANRDAARQLLEVAGAAYDAARFDETAVQTAVRLLWYNVFGTNDAAAKLGGNPYGNRFRWYSGSSNDALLNQRVQRFNADGAALRTMTAYTTSGRLTRPLVTLHTTGDEIIPFWHEILYAFKAQTSGNGLFVPVPVERYGHCNFQVEEVLGAFLLVAFLGSGVDVSTAPLAQRGAVKTPVAKTSLEQARQGFEQAKRAERRIERQQLNTR